MKHEAEIRVETGAPWITWTYYRPDWLAMILGGIVLASCIKCRAVKKIHLGWWGVWFPPTDPKWRHPKRDAFIREHLHGHPGFN